MLVTMGRILYSSFSPTALKKPAITQKRHEARDAVMGAGAGAADGLRAQSLSLDQPRLQQEGAEGRGAVAAPPGVLQEEKAVVFEENDKVRIKADELGEEQRQLRGKDGPECITVRSCAPLQTSGINRLFMAIFLQLRKPRMREIP